MRWCLHRRRGPHAWRRWLHSRWWRHSSWWSSTHSWRRSHWRLNAHSNPSARTCQARWSTHHVRRRHRWRSLNVSVDWRRHSHGWCALSSLNSFAELSGSLVWWRFGTHCYDTFSSQKNKAQRSFHSPFRRDQVGILLFVFFSLRNFHFLSFDLSELLSISHNQIHVLIESNESSYELPTISGVMDCNSNSVVDPLQKFTCSSWLNFVCGHFEKIFSN